MILPEIGGAEVRGKTVLVRADLNVPTQNGRVTDPTRIVRFAPTVAGLLGRGARVVVISHRGRPDGVANPTLSLGPVAALLGGELDRQVHFVPDCVGAVAERVTRTLAPGAVAVLENLRFHSGEEADDRSFALMLSVHGDLYVNDAFSCAHRAHASTHAIVPLMPSFAGPMLAGELAALSRVLDAPERPLTALVGGARLSQKIAMLRHIANQVDRLIIGGGMATTFLAALGIKIGRSPHEPDGYIVARRLLDQAQRNGCEVILPTDAIVAEGPSADAQRLVVPVAEIPAEATVVDVGPATQARILQAIGASRSLLWNGSFGASSLVIAHRAAELTAAGRLVSIAGGDDSAVVLGEAGVADRFTHVSAAGRAFLQSLEGRTLPGIEALRSLNDVLEDS